MSDSQIEALRDRIDAGDRAIVEAVNTRLELVAELKGEKGELGLAFVDPGPRAAARGPAGRDEPRPALRGRRPRAGSSCAGADEARARAARQRTRLDDGSPPRHRPRRTRHAGQRAVRRAGVVREPGVPRRDDERRATAVCPSPGSRTCTSRGSRPTEGLPRVEVAEALPRRFRNEGVFCEALAVRIRDDVAEALELAPRGHGHARAEGARRHPILPPLDPLWRPLDPRRRPMASYPCSWAWCRFHERGRGAA